MVKASITTLNYICIKIVRMVNFKQIDQEYTTKRITLQRKYLASE